MMIWRLSPAFDQNDAVAMLGYIPDFLFESDARPAGVQINERYAHGGGWHPIAGPWPRAPGPQLIFPPDPPAPQVVYRMVAWTQLREERIMVYEHSWVAIVQPDDTYEIARLD